MTVDEALALLDANGPDSRRPRRRAKPRPDDEFPVGGTGGIIDLNRIAEPDYIKDEEIRADWRDDATAHDAILRCRRRQVCRSLPRHRNRRSPADPLARHDRRIDRSCRSGCRNSMVLRALDGEVVVRGPKESARSRRRTCSRCHDDDPSADRDPRRDTVPAMPPGAGFAIEEFSRRHGDFAIAAIAAVIERDGPLLGAAIATGGISARPSDCAAEADSRAQGLTETPSRSRRCGQGGRAAVGQNGSADYRRELTRVLTERACGEAAQRIGGGERCRRMMSA